MKKEYIKPIIIHIKTWNDDALLNTVSLYDINKRDPIENIAIEDNEPLKSDDKWGTIWND